MTLITKALIILASFTTASKGIDFLCEFRSDLNWATVGNVYSCWNAQVTIVNSWTVLESVRGQHIDGKTNLDVKALHVTSDPTGLENLPKGIDKFFPNLIFIQWWYGSLKSVTVDDFQAFPELQNLNLGNNKIFNLDGDLFKFTPNLAFISFFNNKITNTGSNLLADLNNLNYVHFGFNPCIDLWANSTEGIQDLKQKLSNDCPPLASTNPPTTTTISTTTEDTQCDLRCTLGEEIDELSVKLLKQSQEIQDLRNSNIALNLAIEVLKDENNKMKDTIDVQNEWILKVENRVSETERQIREMNARP